MSLLAGDNAIQIPPTAVGELFKSFLQQIVIKTNL